MNIPRSENVSLCLLLLPSDGSDGLVEAGLIGLVRLEFRLGFRVQRLRFRIKGFRIWGQGSRAGSLGIGGWGLVGLIDKNLLE